VFGPIVCVVCSAIYPAVSSVAGFFLLRLVHGFSTGFKPTGQTAYISDVIPVQRRGEAMGLIGTASTIGMAGGPAAGGVIANNFGLDTMFYFSSLLGVLSIVILLRIKETVMHKHSFGVDLLKISKQDLFEPLVVAPCIVMVLSAYSYGALFTVMPDFGEFVGIKNKGLLFTYLTIASLLVRLMGGKASDRWGRIPVLKISIGCIALSMLIVGIAETQLELILGVTLYGFAQGVTSPTLLAWSADLSDENHKGRGIASLYIFMEMGIGIGALVSGFVYGNQSANFIWTFALCSVLSVLAFLYLMMFRSTTKIKS